MKNNKILSVVSLCVSAFIGVGLFVGCGEAKINKNIEHEHIYTDYVSNNDATFFKDGTKTAKCSNGNCNETNTIIDVDSQIMTELPVFSINTENMIEIASKDEYIKCDVSLSNTDYEYEFIELGGKIKGRGNSTWNAPKKPYKLKFDKKVDLFGNGAAKTWTILANYFDKSQIRNYIAFGIADLFDSQNMCSSTHFINLFINNEYKGIYLICEQIEVADTRVEVDESYNDVNTGYLIEMDGRASAEGVLDRDYFDINGKFYAIKSPDTEEDDFTLEHVNYIKTYMTDVMQQIESGDDWETVANLIDARSFAENYIVQELFHNADIAFSSFYMYKEKDGKLCAGPVWDFDLSAGLYFSNIVDEYYNPEKHYVCVVNPWYKALVQYDDFKLMVAQILREKFDIISNKINTMTEFVLSNEKSFSNEFILWDESLIGWKNEVINLQGWLIKSLNFLKANYEIYI